MAAAYCRRRAFPGRRWMRHRNGYAASAIASTRPMRPFSLRSVSTNACCSSSGRRQATCGRIRRRPGQRGAGREAPGDTSSAWAAKRWTRSAIRTCCAASSSRRRACRGTTERCDRRGWKTCAKRKCASSCARSAAACSTNPTVARSFGVCDWWCASTITKCRATSAYCAFPMIRRNGSAARRSKSCGSLPAQPATCRRSACSAAG